MNIELCREMKRLAAEKRRMHQDVYGCTGRSYNLKQMEKCDDLIDIYETAENAERYKARAVERTKCAQAKFIIALKEEIKKYGKISLYDFNQWMEKEGKAYLL